jgi:preprotein translocase subunit SecB
MAEAINASFKFEKFRIPNFSYNESEKSQVTLALEFIPYGKYYQKDARFEIELLFNAYDDDGSKTKIISVKSISTFKFEDSLSFNDLPSFFYKNSLAIIFPFIRSFISTLTLQANTGLILLGLMNLSNLEQILISNTIEVQE